MYYRVWFVIPMRITDVCVRFTDVCVCVCIVIPMRFMYTYIHIRFKLRVT